MDEFVLCEKCRKSGFKRPSACCPPQPKKQILYFHDKAIGDMKIEDWEGEPWLFWKHPDGQWVSYRKATERDISLACRIFQGTSEKDFSRG